ncbi:ABC transporter ATP-binding protein [Poriferisphaera sp. WC338]|uniref:ABC transporter ATP-binding protein n=1 Tax=Poriferisphaera sp. WC338 TaxID=3425129 RepID=UPI003D815EB9
MIHAHELVKWYGPTLAVDCLSFEIPEGQIVGVLGPNGAGKSTTIRMLTGYLPATSGTATINGHDIATDSMEARAQVGYLPEGTPLYGEARVVEYLHYRGSLLGMSRKERMARIDAVCDRCGLSHLRRRVISRLSKGNRQRVGLAQALLNEPPVLILDEPTSALDPTQIGEVRSLIRELAGRHTILLSTHILPEVEKTADRIMIISSGRLVADGSLSEIRQRINQDALVVVQAKISVAGLQTICNEINGVTISKVTEDNGWSTARVRAAANMDLREKIGQKLLEKQAQIRELRLEEASLESFFIKITDMAETEESAAG